jgi:hypothetical protein
VRVRACLHGARACMLAILCQLVDWQRRQVSDHSGRTHCFTVRSIARKAAVRAVLQAFKIEPTIFAVWMRILARVPHSTLYMLRLNEGAAAEAQVSSNIGPSLQRVLIDPL